MNAGRELDWDRKQTIALYVCIQQSKDRELTKNYRERRRIDTHTEKSKQTKSFFWDARVSFSVNMSFRQDCKITRWGDVLHDVAT